MYVLKRFGISDGLKMKFSGWLWLYCYFKTYTNYS